MFEPKEHGAARPKQRHSEQNPFEVGVDHKIDGRHPANGRGTADQRAYYRALLMRTKRRCSQNDRQHAGRQNAATHDAEDVREPQIQARPEDIKLG
jgi:hypothetical protein